MWVMSMMVMWWLWLARARLVEGEEVHPIVYCTPRLWEGGKWSLEISHTDQGSHVWESTSQLSVDVPGQRIVSTETGTRDGQPYSVYYLFYYPGQTLFVMQNGKCEVKPLTGNFSHHCQQTPDDRHQLELVFEFLGNMMSQSEASLMTMGGRGVLEGGLGYFYSSQLQDPKVPVMVERNGVMDGVPKYRVDNYFNHTKGIKDPSVFTPPAQCIQAGNTVIR